MAPISGASTFSWALDVFTHFVLPYAAATALRRPRAERLAAGLGGYAPDLDILWTWVPRVWPDAYPFVHRGFSHTVWGGAALAVALLWLLTRPAIRSRWKRLSALAFGGALAAIAVAGSFTHTLLLDALTITGTPAFWPLTHERWTINFFFWGATLALPVSLYLTIQLWRGRASDRAVRIGGLVVVAVLVATAGVRAATYPDREAGAVVVPTSTDWRWVRAEPAVGPNGTAGWVLSNVVWGETTASRSYFGNATGAALDAAEACRATGAYRAWRWGGNRAEVVNATVLPGGWRILFVDAAARFDFEEGAFRILGWKPPFGPNVEAPYEPEKRGIACSVVDGVVVETRRPASIWG